MKNVRFFTDLSDILCSGGSARRLFAALLVLLAFLAPPGSTPQVVSAQGAAENLPVALCLPGIYLDDTDHCAPAGPSSYLSQLAQQGIVLPLPPLAAASTNPELSRVNVRYGEVRNNNAPVFASLEDAVKNRAKLAVRRLSGEFVYISYTDEQIVNGKRFYMIDANAWMTANDVSRIGVLPQQQGVTLSRTPTHAFGWVLTYWAPGPVQTKRTPGTQIDDYTGRELKLYEIVPVFGEQIVDGSAWYQLGPDEWAPGRYIARVIPDTTPPEGVSGSRWIEVNLFEQTLAVYDNYQMVFATIIASGADPFWTQPGVFQVYKKLAYSPMTGAFEADRSDAYYLEDVPWTLYYDGARALHGAYWRAKMGFPQSHGCVNMTVGDARWVFDWAQEGDWVYVWDPSGETPTDPSLYGSGGY